MKRLGLIVTLALGLPTIALAEIGTWQTDPNVGPSEVSYRLTFTCTGPAVVCDSLNLYDDTQVSTLTDAATLQLDEVADTLQFDLDSMQDLDDGMGVIPAYATLEGSNMTFAGLALFGVPEVVDPAVFSTDQPLISVAGLELLPPGTYPISTTMSWGGVSDVVGDISLILPRIVVTPSPVAVTGTLEILGDVDFDGFVEFELRDLVATTQSTDQYTDVGLGLVVDIHVTANLLANLSGEIAAPLPVPLLGAPGLAALCGMLGAAGAAAVRRRA